jgi:hypothetical protein
MKLIINVRGKEKEILSTFHITICKRTKKEFQLDPETFYKQYAGKIHDQTFEIMVNQTTPFSLVDLVSHKTHVHEGNDKKQYICYPTEVKSFPEAVSLAMMWVLVTTFHMKYRADVGFFESFGKWILRKSHTRDDVNPFDEFPLWISETMGWKIELTSKAMEIASLHRKDVFELLVQKN